MRNILFIFILLLFFKPTEAQQHLVDSITKELQQPMADTNRAVSMMRLAIDYEVVDTAKAYQAYRDAIKFASEKKLYFNLGRIYHNQSFLFSTAADYTRSNASLDTAVLYYQKSDNPKAKKWEANAYGDIANGLKIQNEYQQSVQYHLRCISLFEKLGNEGELVIRYCNLSTLFGDINEYAKQREYADKALASRKKIGYGSTPVHGVFYNCKFMHNAG